MDGATPIGSGGDEARDARLLAAELRRRLGPSPSLPEWPLVSIVVVTRDRAGYLRKMLAGLVERTDYPWLELIVVDNGSTDDSVALLRTAPAPFAISVLTNPSNESFSDANNQGARLASGELLLFLNNDAEPFEPGWLRELVACQRASGAGVVGTTLLHWEADAGFEHGYVVQQRGIQVRDESGLLVPVLRDFRTRPLGEGLGLDVESVAVAAACLLVDRGLYERVDGFTPGYVYGGEDIDLSLKARSMGAGVLCSGRSFVIHHPGGTRRTAAWERRRAWQRLNRRLLQERWGPRARRELELDRLSGGGVWAAASRDGDGGLPSLDEVMALGFCLRAGAPGSAGAVDGGVGELVDAVRGGLTGRGHRCVALCGDEVDDPVGLNYDVAVHFRGPARFVPKAGQLNVLWCMSDFDASMAVECSRYDLVVTEHGELADRLRAAGTTAPVVVIDGAEAGLLPVSESDRPLEAGTLERIVGELVEAVGVRAHEIDFPMRIRPDQPTASG